MFGRDTSMNEFVLVSLNYFEGIAFSRFLKMPTTMTVFKFLSFVVDATKAQDNC